MINKAANKKKGDNTINPKNENSKSRKRVIPSVYFNRLINLYIRLSG